MRSAPLVVKLAAALLLISLGAISCVPGERAKTCKDLTEEAFKIQAAKLCPVESGPWEDCPHADALEAGLKVALEACDHVD